MKKLIVLFIAFLMVFTVVMPVCALPGAFNGFSNANPLCATVTSYIKINDEYIVYRSAAQKTKDFSYVISDNPSNSNDPVLLMEIEITDYEIAKGVIYWDGSTPYRFSETASGDTVITEVLNLANIVSPGTKKYDRLFTAFTNIFGDLGLSLKNRSNVLNDAYWIALANSKNVKASTTSGNSGKNVQPAYNALALKKTDIYSKNSAGRYVKTGERLAADEKLNVLRLEGDYAAIASDSGDKYVISANISAILNESIPAALKASAWVYSRAGTSSKYRLERLPKDYRFEMIGVVSKFAIFMLNEQMVFVEKKHVQWQ